MNAADHVYLPSSSGEIIAPAVVFAGPTGVRRGVRDGMGCALCIALGRRLCRSTVVAFEALGVTEDRRTADPDTQPTAGFKAIMREAAETGSSPAALSVLVVAAWM